MNNELLISNACILISYSCYSVKFWMDVNKRSIKIIQTFIKTYG